MREAFAALAAAVRAEAADAADRGARELADAIRSNAPAETGALRDSIVVEPARPGPGSAVARVAIPLHGGHREDDTNLTLHVEFGTSRTAPNPFIRRSVDGLAPGVADDLADSIRAAVRRPGLRLPT